MLELVNEYYAMFLVISLLLLGLTLWIRVKKVASKKDKLIYSIYSLVMIVFTVLLILYKLGG
ncbi:MAG: hypothetical protein ACQEWU_10165 [Bacillota bacterium]|uniref:hypothetical protein n=1 Tax=Virgibacillus sp. Bac332 TaxID=2419842 RepID=UPI000EF44224|nr:hypothetical protein [Virgibacillus sp. Bac332]